MANVTIVERRLARSAAAEIGLAAALGSGYPLAPHHQIPLANTDESGRTRFSRRDRLWLAAAGVALLGMLAVAAVLKPSPRRRGTHEQLGLPPCTFSVLFGRPCPTCGMTTAWAHLVRGQWYEAGRANLGGTLLGLLAMVAAPWLLASAARGNWFGVAPSGRGVAWITFAVLVITLIDWAVRLLTGCPGSHTEHINHEVLRWIVPLCGAVL
jgi:hypothetical protein